MGAGFMKMLNDQGLLEELEAAKGVVSPPRRSHFSGRSHHAAVVKERNGPL